MGKDDFMTAKVIGKKIKAKSMQKLAFYCEMCQKQCRDANGFKCHTMSESHLRNMSLFAENSKQKLQDFSKSFERGFLDILIRRHKTKRVNANVIYNEYILDRNHTHMNATIWETLSSFVQYLGSTGKCEVDEDAERGWYVKYIEPDAGTKKGAGGASSSASASASASADNEDQERKLIKQQIEMAKTVYGEGNDEDDRPSEIHRDVNDIANAPIVIKSSAFLQNSKKRKRIIGNQEGDAAAAQQKELCNGVKLEGSGGLGGDATIGTSSNKAMKFGQNDGEETKVSLVEGHHDPYVDDAANQSLHGAKTRKLEPVWAGPGLIVVLRESNRKAVIMSADDRDSIVLMTLNESADVLTVAEDRIGPTPGDIDCEVVVLKSDSADTIRQRGVVQSIDFTEKKALVRLTTGKRAGSAERFGINNICEINLSLIE